MSKELKITRERIKKLVAGLSSCPKAREAVEDAFPEAFEVKKKWVDISSETKVYLESRDDGYRLFMDGGDGNYFALSRGDKDTVDFVIPMDISSFERGNYKVEIGSDGYFKILKKRN